MSGAMTRRRAGSFVGVADAGRLPLPTTAPSHVVAGVSAADAGRLPLPTTAPSHVVAGVSTADAGRLPLPTTAPSHVVAGVSTAELDTTRSTPLARPMPPFAGAAAAGGLPLPATAPPFADPDQAAQLLVQGVTYQVDGYTILDGVDLAIEAGQVTVVVGPNGAGKSTLLALLAGDLSPATGQITWQGQPVTDLTVRQLARLRAVMAGEGTIAFPFTVREVVAMGRAPWHGTPEAASDQATVSQAMDATDTDSLAERRFPTLSSGEKARASFARCLVQQGRVILLDEPTAALDISHQELVMSLAREEAQAGAAVVAVVHDLALAAAWADQVALLNAGRLEACGPPEQVLTAQRLSAVYQHPVDVITDPGSGARLVIPRRGEGS